MDYLEGYENDVSKVHYRNKFGYYTMEPGFINGRNHYTIMDNDSKAGEYGLWFSEDAWFLGLTKERGKHKGRVTRCGHLEPNFGYFWEQLSRFFGHFLKHILVIFDILKHF